METLRLLNKTVEFIFKNPSFLLPLTAYYLLLSFIIFSLGSYFSMLFFIFISVTFFPFFIYSLISYLENKEYTFSIPKKIFKDFFIATIFKLSLFILFLFFIAISILSFYLRIFNFHYFFIFSIFPLYFLIKLFPLEIIVSTKKLNLVDSIKYSFRITKNNEIKILICFLIFTLISLGFLIAFYPILKIFEIEFISFIIDSFIQSFFFSSILAFSYFLVKK